jgi:serine/threonine protein kinase
VKKKPEVIEAGKEEVYMVETHPVGWRPCLDSEKTVKLLVLHVCKALAALHCNQLVHRDVRLNNIVQLNNSFMLIDLETVGRTTAQALPPGFDCFTDWNDKMLEGGRYTLMSDSYSLGRLMEKDLLGSDASEEAIDLMQKLKKKDLIAAAALRHPWLQN